MVKLKHPSLFYFMLRRGSISPYLVTEVGRGSGGTIVYGYVLDCSSRKVSNTFANSRIYSIRTQGKVKNNTSFGFVSRNLNNKLLL